MASEIAKIQDPARWASGAEAAVSFARVVGCGALAPFCAAQYLGERAGRAVVEESIVGGQRLGDAVSSTGDGIIDRIGANGERLLNAARSPFSELASMSMWIAIGVIAFSAMIIVLVAAALWKF